MEKLLMLGTTPASMELIEMAKSRGVYTITTDYLEPEESEAKLISDEYWMINTAQVDLLEKKCREEGVTAIISGMSEFNAERMAELCQRLNLPCWCTPESWDAVQKKHNFKRHCRENGVPVAMDYFLSNPPTEEELNAIQLPVVVKPVDMNSNYGLSYCYTKEDVIEGCAFARSMSKSETVIVERMLHGVEYTAYYAMAAGEASLLALVPEFSQPGYPENCYCMMTSATNRLKYYVSNVEPQVKKMLKASGCHDGVCWIQLFLDEDGGFYAIEMGFRLSGDMFMVPMKQTIGFDALAWQLDIALGIKHTPQDLPVSVTEVPEKCICSYILWSHSEGRVKEIIGLEEIAELPHMYIRPITQVEKKFVQYQYMEVFVFPSDNYQQMIATIEKINKTVRILDEDGNDALIYFDNFDAVRRIAEEGLQGM